MISRFRPSDGITISFCLLFAALALFNLDESPYLINLFILYLSFAFFQTFLIACSDKSKFFRLSRDMLFPLVVVFVIFDSLTVLIPLVNPHDLDLYLAELDYYIFGLYPTVYFERFMHPLLSDLLQFCYSLYYFLPFILGISLKLKAMDREFEQSLSLVLLCFYLSYVGYVIVPALGPRYAIDYIHSRDIVDGLISGQLRGLLNSIEGIKRDAFPSGHTGVSLLVVILAWKYSRGLFLPLAMITLGIIIATVYFRYHYVIDVIAGIGLTVVTITVGKVYYYLFENHLSQDIPCQEDKGKDNTSKGHT